MRKLMLALLPFLLVPAFVLADDACRGKTINCDDDCSGESRPYDGSDTCKTAWNTGAGCQTSFGYCAATQFQPCVAKSVSCFDECSGQYKFFTNLDSCATRQSDDGGCNEAYAYCRGP